MSSVGRQRAKKVSRELANEDQSDEEDVEVGHRPRPSRKKKRRSGWLGGLLKFVGITALVLLLALTPTIMFVSRQHGTQGNLQQSMGAASPLRPDPPAQAPAALRAVPPATPASLAQPASANANQAIHVDITAAPRPGNPPAVAPAVQQAPPAVQKEVRSAAPPAHADPGAQPPAGGGAAAKSGLGALIQGQLALLPLSDEQKERLEKGKMAFHASAAEQSCADACEAKGASLQCEESWFALLNRCEVLSAAFPESTGCLDHLFGNDLPAYNPSLQSVLVNANPRSYATTCGSSGPASVRLCPCQEVFVDKEKELAEFNARLKAEALKQLTRKRKDLEAGRVGEKMGDWWATHKPGELIEQVGSGSVTFVPGDRGEACFYACRKRSLICRSFWFDILNNCEALREAFPQMKTCTRAFYGRDMPALRLDDMMGLVNQQPRAHAGSCGGRHGRTRRLCGCEVGDVMASDSVSYHTVYNVQASKYFEWQVRYMHFWHKDVGMSGKITRLLSAGGPDHLFNSIPTHVSPNYVSRLPNDNYSPYNKPHALDRWLQEAKPKEDVIIVIDPDCMFVHPIDIPVVEGSPVAQQAFYSFDFEKDDIPMQIARRYCHGCTFLDPIAVPIIIHRKDIEKIAPLWLEKTVEIRADQDNWLNGWWNTSVSGVQLGWTAEMFGYVFAASELGIRHEIWSLQSVPKVHTTLDTPIIHFHVDVPVSNGKVWYKHWDNAGENIIWPLPADTNEVTRVFLTKIKQAYDAIGPSNYTWRNPRNKYELEIRR